MQILVGILGGLMGRDERNDGRHRHHQNHFGTQARSEPQQDDGCQCDFGNAVDGDNKGFGDLCRPFRIPQGETKYRADHRPNDKSQQGFPQGVTRINK